MKSVNVRTHNDSIRNGMATKVKTYSSKHIDNNRYWIEDLWYAVSVGFYLIGHEVHS